MFLLGLLLPVCYIPGYLGATIPTQWALLSIALLPSLWQGRMAGFHWLGILFLAYACASQIWSLDYGQGLWIAMIWMLAFWWGSVQVSLIPLWKGLAIGIALNVPIAYAQAHGWQSVPTMYGGAAGLLYNSTLLGACCALVLAALIENRLWFYTPALAYGLYLSHSRGALLALALALIAKHIHWLAALALLIAGAFVLTYSPIPSDVQRLQIWTVVVPKLSFFGWGAGSLTELYIFPDRHLGTQIIKVEFAHNDYLQLLFEYGLGAIPIFILFGYAIVKSLSPVLICIAILACYWFPIYAPIPAFIGFAYAGYLLRIHANYLALRSDRGQHLLPRTAYA
jgi:hypothetical protein